jgi:hypothetical protein
MIFPSSGEKKRSFFDITGLRRTTPAEGRVLVVG